MRLASGSVAVLAALQFASCGHGVGDSGMSDSTYVAVITELIRNKNVPGLDTVLSAQRRREAMERHGVTPELLERKSVSLAENPARFAEVWGKIQLKLEAGG
jgi:hypothetical protein